MRVRNIITLGSVLGQAFAWGGVGHRTVAYIAYKYLSPASQSYVNNILAYTDGLDISDAAVWPDQIRRGRPYTALWHFIDAKDNPPLQCGIKYPSDCGSKPTDGCVITALANQTALFMDPLTDRFTRREALKFIIHFIGDMHQPLHTENAFRGGNQIPVCFREACANNSLHAVWDAEIPNKIVGLPSRPVPSDEKAAAQEWADLLVSSNEGEPQELLAAQCSEVGDPNKCTLAWANESNAWVCNYVLKPSYEWLTSNDLSLEYFDGAVPIVKQQVTNAGLRLAAWLEALIAVSKSLQTDSEQKTLGDLEF